jgi:hypothetical protein
MRRLAWFCQADQVLLDMPIMAHTTNAHHYQLPE